MIAYKLFRVLKSRSGEIFSLFIDKTQSIPLHEWIEAEVIITKGYAPRPGWHAASLPKADHLSPNDRVWAEIEISDYIEWQTVANTQLTKDIRNRIPKNGFYRFKRPENQGGEWLIAGSMKVNKILTKDEVELMR